MKKKPTTRLDVLRERHAELNDQVDQIVATRHITPEQHERLKALKLLKLRVKDMISTLETEQPETVSLVMPDFQPK